jgi:hypothetical protein
MEIGLNGLVQIMKAYEAKNKQEKEEIKLIKDSVTKLTEIVNKWRTK